MMTRKDFNQVAAATAELVIHMMPVDWADAIRDEQRRQLEEAGNRVANYLGVTNPRFDRERFVAAVIKLGGH